MICLLGLEELRQSWRLVRAVAVTVQNDRGSDRPAVRPSQSDPGMRAVGAGPHSTTGAETMSRPCSPSRVPTTTDPARRGGDRPRPAGASARVVLVVVVLIVSWLGPW